MTAQSQVLKIRRPDDWHIHLRDDDMLKTVVPFTSEFYGRAIVMPNLVPPVTTVDAALAQLVLHFVTDPAQAASELRRVLRPGGVVAACVWGSFSMAEPIARVLGKTGINVMTRLMGLILAALAIEVMAGGLVKIFPVLAG